MKKSNFIVLIVFVLLVITAAEMIGFQSVRVGNISVSILPLVFAVLIAMILGIPLWRKSILEVIYSKANVKFSAKYLLYIMLPLMARYGADVAPRLREIISVGWVMLFQELGNVGTVVLGLPIALLIGLKREAIGATLGLGREGELAYISEKYTLESPEGRGVLSLYLIGTIFGAIFFSFLAPIMLSLGFDFRALAMSAGVGSASMMTAATSSLVALLPNEETTITAFAAASQLLTSFLGTYTMVFVAIPLQTFMYKKLTRLKGNDKNEQ